MPSTSSTHLIMCIFHQLLTKLIVAEDVDSAVNATALLRNNPYIVETFDPSFCTISISWSWSLRTWRSLSHLGSLFAFSDADNEVMKASSAMTSIIQEFSIWEGTSLQKPLSLTWSIWISNLQLLKPSVFWNDCQEVFIFSFQSGFKLNSWNLGVRARHF